MSTERSDTYGAQSRTGTSAERKAPAHLDAESIFAGRRELTVIYHGQEYRLRITRNDKLILTK